MAEVARPAGPASTISEEKRQRLLELVRGRTAARPTDLAEDEVMVWPSLVVVEALSAIVFTFILVFVSLIINSPLASIANPTVTPNPSKAPWYFLNLQELLLHMHPSLAGVIVPTLALVLIAAIPFVDRSPLGVGILFTSDKGKRIIAFSTVYTAVCVLALIALDEVFGRGLAPLKGEVPEIVQQQMAPVAIMTGLSVILGVLIWKIFKPTRRELIMAFFTGFVVSYVVLTVVGTAFRGAGMDLSWPWDIPTHE